MFGLPCSTRSCTSDAVIGDQCTVCYELTGYPAGWCRSRDEAWLSGRTIPEIDAIPVPAGCFTLDLGPRSREGSRE